MHNSARNSKGITYVEVLVAGVIFAMIAVSFGVVAQMISESVVRQRQKMQANNFAQAIIEGIREYAKLNYINLDDVPLMTYPEMMQLLLPHSHPASNLYPGMKALYTVNEDMGSKEIEIEVTYGHKEIRTAKYHTRVTQTGVISGGTATGRLLYYKKLMESHYNRTPDPDSPLNMVFEPDDPNLFAGAGGMIISAPSNHPDGRHVSTISNSHGYYTLKNIKIGAPIDIIYYRAGSKPNNPDIEPGYYFFKFNEVNRAGNPNVDWADYATGQMTRQVSFDEVGEVIDLGIDYCARTWLTYFNLQYRGNPKDTPLPALKFMTPGMIKVEGSAVKWGPQNMYDYETGNVDWDVSHLLWVNPQNLTSRNNREYNLVLGNLRGCPSNNFLNFTFKIERAEG
ncbi:MAG: hypothetical protein GF384_05295, partial [Elusimicrobia bacterium]|nr:hypothetical protein [Elusimicrobiota bacterium]MBD3412204.1 hypothetical protein [Elusimicrobiota bacterium]